MFLLCLLVSFSAALRKSHRLSGLEGPSSGGCKSPNQDVGRALLFLKHVRESFFASSNFWPLPTVFGLLWFMDASSQSLPLLSDGRLLPACFFVPSPLLLKTSVVLDGGPLSS